MTVRRFAVTSIGWLLRLPIWAYRLVLSPVLPRACRYAPSCSEYALEAIARHGPVRGPGLALWRILRCNPWGGSGYDPVPSPTASRRAPDPRQPTTASGADED